jgi:hypothetical protein
VLPSERHILEVVSQMFISSIPHAIFQLTSLIPLPGFQPLFKPFTLILPITKCDKKAQEEDGD